MNNKQLLALALATTFSAISFATEVTTTNEETTVVVEENEINAQEENLRKLATLSAAVQEVLTEETTEVVETQE